MTVEREDSIADAPAITHQMSKAPRTQSHLHNSPFSSLMSSFPDFRTCPSFPFPFPTLLATGTRSTGIDCESESESIVNSAVVPASLLRHPHSQEISRLPHHQHRTASSPKLLIVLRTVFSGKCNSLNPPNPTFRVYSLLSALRLFAVCSKSPSKPLMHLPITRCHNTNSFATRSFHFHCTLESKNNHR
jgi:hypothetical protein